MFFVSVCVMSIKLGKDFKVLLLSVMSDVVGMGGWLLFRCV